MAMPRAGVMLARRGGMKCLALLALAVTACTSNEGSSSQSLTQPPGECGMIETHVFGVYAAPQGEVTVRIDRPGHHALVLSAHDATTWHVVAGPDATIDGIYAVGYAPQTVDAPNGIKLVNDSKDTTGAFACGYAWPNPTADCNTDQLLRLSSKVVNHEANSFHGCRSASSFTVRSNLATTSDCSEGQSDFVANCYGEDSPCGPIFL